MEIVTIILNIAYPIQTLASLSKDILLLRCLLIIAQSLMISFGIISENISVLSWNSLFVVINTVRVIKILNERRPIELPPDLDLIYRDLFKHLSRREFLYFWNTGSQKIAKDELLCKENQVQKELFFILHGKVLVEQGKKQIATVSENRFVGELSLLTGHPANADVIAKGEVEVVAWSQEKLRNLETVNPNLLFKIQQVLSRDVAHKLKNKMSLTHN